MDKRVLVVDDEIAIVEGLTTHLELEQYESAGATNRSAALAMMAESHYPVIITDLCLGTQEDGLALLDAILASERACRVVVLSGYVTNDLEQELLERGVAVVLRKPVMCEAIVEAIDALLAEMEADGTADAEVDLDELYLTLRRRLYSIPTRRYRLPADRAEDVIQDAWLLFLQKRAAIRCARSWLAGTVANLSKQGIDRIVRHRETAVDDADFGAIVDSRTPAQAVDVIALRSALDRLDDRARSLCDLIGIQGLSYDEVSARLDLPLGSIGPLYIRAKQKLRNALSH